MKLIVSFDLEDGDEYADPGHEMGVTEIGYIRLGDLLRQFGADNIDIRKARSDE